MARSMTLWVAVTTRNFSTFLAEARLELPLLLNPVHQAQELLLVRTLAVLLLLTLARARLPLQAVVCHVQVQALLQLEMQQVLQKYAS